ncbi:hypothetical protein SAMN04488028_104116 [Reichenbachiella agariperforans]|uniref:Uncharacterized protein n=1 Tax=Reichenbachiella agariperforans TaxID=156994 RepID=A0A1M6RCF2_REIAG|nr:hypothetical protein SAMN04488028_104116 [Reichenbachiella agariperforans]
MHKGVCVSNGRGKGVVREIRLSNKTVFVEITSKKAPNLSGASKLRMIKTQMPCGMEGLLQDYYLLTNRMQCTPVAPWMRSTNTPGFSADTSMRSSEAPESD